MSGYKTIQPSGWNPPKGYSNGILAPVNGRLLFTAGQIAWDAQQQIVSDNFSQQFFQALSNVVEVVQAAGGSPEHLMRLTVYVTDRQEYLADLPAVGAAYREVMGRHYPAMALVEVAGLLEPGAKIEIEGTAVLP